jgi:hypothetical protein
MTFEPAVFFDLPVELNEKGEEWRQLDYVLEMQVSSGELCWTVKHKNIKPEP